MKVKRIQWLLVVSIVFAGFVCGFFALRNLNRTPVRTYVLQPASGSGNNVLVPDATAAEPTAGEAEDSEKAEDMAPVNINSATLEQLDVLPGIGPTIAQRIIDYRSANGPFPSVGALINVSGIGEKKLEAIWDLVTVEGD